VRLHSIYQYILIYPRARATVASMNSAVKAARLMRALADPLRYAILAQLMGGAATASELVAATEGTQSNVSNHLALLRDAGVVAAERQGRHAVYSLTGPAIADLIEAVQRATGDGAFVRRAIPEIAVARTCYDHLAGRLGVALFRSLVAARAIHDVENGERRARKVRSGLGKVKLGPNASGVFGALGIDLVDAASHRRQFATACSDWTETQPHLGGALGAALQQALLREKWVLRRGGTRAVHVTARGRSALADRFGIDFDRVTSGSGLASAK
jgi:DNA-binding transcriptional ArsR family regulator